MSEKIKQEIEMKEEKTINESGNVVEKKIITTEEVESDSPASKPQQKFAWILTIAVIALVAIIGIAWIAAKRSATTVEVKTGETDEKKEADKTMRQVKLEPDLLTSANIETEGVTQRPAIAKLYVTGTVELNPEKTEMATPLVGGRIENVFYGVGNYVNRGAILAVISSPQLAQLHGKMHEAKTRYELAQRNLARVQKSENRVSILQAKAKLDESEATLKRTKRLIELGAGAGKDLVSAETNFKT
ncbi:MAG: efflux RND transporter periplasmic adaptor subunit, partial [Pyrinomonadaceae bacterium]|nr:efflux RND transporter periplasmic adaptor subunit [Pyrinomonadaceae bacterium]